MQILLPCFIWEEIMCYIPKHELDYFALTSKFWFQLVVNSSVKSLEFINPKNARSLSKTRRKSITQLNIEVVYVLRWKLIRELFPNLKCISISMGPKYKPLKPKQKDKLASVANRVKYIKFIWSYKSHNLDDLWLLGINFTALELNLLGRTEEELVTIANSINPFLKVLTIHLPKPFLKVMEIFSRNLKRLKKLDVFYSNHADLVPLIPQSRTLNKVLVDFGASQVSNANMIVKFPDCNELKALLHLKLQYLEFNETNMPSSPIGTQLKSLELRHVIISGRQLSFHFPHITRLIYQIKGKYIKEVYSILELRRLSKVTFILPDLDTINYPEMGQPIHQVTFLRLDNIRVIDSSFWLWISTSFPQLSTLSLQTLNKRKEYVPSASPASKGSLTSLCRLFSNILFPLAFYMDFDYLAPNLEELNLDVLLSSEYWENYELHEKPFRVLFR
ncbi:hypothetical protein DSO57_1011706 [Entomophthora muscae]|uniref:Uncharacterized protein n=1 Tax=Entomophthora muscae TaxID=34485 RepID=A0ACC2SJ60_9FUNG|nr:hypothetical protein DSO57_1011706 [Entomophthora muscae]